ncbi:hypothetical protein [Actinoplanes sp. NPDC051859]|uniref:hypothetical protein n=1 Tax=Actinoplanes sp. NPDC051859 TaxID=3363909 RepID=UPI003790D453
MSVPFRDRPLNAAEVERLRLALSTFRDGSGQYLGKLGLFMPDFLDFERATAMVCGGTTGENKGVFDVAVPTPDGLPIGVSCKMASVQPARLKSSFMELSNSKKKFDDEFARQGIIWQSQPKLAGPAIVKLVESWHSSLRHLYDLAGSRYFVLSHDARWENFQLLCFPLNLSIADPFNEVEWCNEGSDKNGGPSTVAGYVNENGRSHRLWQLYQNSGGQLKYYPLLEWAEWVSPVFRLDMPPARNLREKIDEYFPGSWPS